MMEHLNQTQFAERIGVTAPSVNAAIKKGRIVRTLEGIDPNHEKNLKYASEAVANKKRRPKKVATGKPKKGNGNGRADKKTDLEPESLEGPEVILDTDSLYDIKLKQQINSLYVKYQKERMGVVPRDLVVRFFAHMYLLDQNQFKPLGEKLSTELASIFEVDEQEKIKKAEEKIDGEIFKILEHIKRVLNDFMKQIGAKEIT